MIAKIYQNQFATTPSMIIDTINEFNIDLKINDGSRGNLIVSYDTIDITSVPNLWDDSIDWNDADAWSDSVTGGNLKPYNKINFYDVVDSQDILIFSGYIYNVGLTLTGYDIEVRDENDLMNKKIVLEDKVYTTQTPLQILNDITSDWETETGEDWSVVSSVSDTLTIEFKEGDTFYAVLNELSQNLGYNWIVKGQTIYFDEVVSEDKSSGPNFEELVYNGNDHSEDNINNIRLEYQGNVANMILGGDTTTKYLAKDIDSRGAIAEYRGFQEGGLNAQTTNYLNLKKQELFSFNFEITLDKTDIDLGDKVACRIEQTPKNLMDFEGDVIVNQVRLEYKNATIFKTLSVDTQVIKRSLLSNRLEGIERSLDLLLKK